MSNKLYPKEFKLDRQLTREIIIHVAPQYIELLHGLQAKDGWVRLPDKFEEIFRQMNLDPYVQVFDDEKLIHGSLALFLMGKDGVKSFNDDLNAMSPVQQAEFARDLLADVSQEEKWSWIEDCFPETPEQQADLATQFHVLSEDQKAEASKRAVWFWTMFFGLFYQYLALMLHGQKLTSLVSQAKQGSIDAFAKAVHIEPRLLRSHPFFHERFERAKADKDVNFLKRIGNRIATHGSPGKIRYPGLYVVFAILEAAGLLGGEFTHEEILDMCDEAGLDRWQNRIEDVGYLTKRLNEYRSRVESS